MLVLPIIMFAFGLCLLVWGSSLFVDSASALAAYLRLPEVLIGATIVSLGTTLPEILFSTMAAARNLPDMALGNALGSILCNTGLIAGLLLLIKPVVLNKRETQNVLSGASFLTIAFLLYLFSGIVFGGLTRATGLFLLFVCALYTRNTIVHSSIHDNKSVSAASVRDFTFRDAVQLVLEAIAIYIGASLLVKSGPILARSLGIPEMIISLTLVALGTSLPELVTSLVSLHKNHASLSLGNIIGADILNFLLVGAASAVICPAPYPHTILKLELPFIFFLLSVFCIPSILRQKASRIQGILLLALYAVYLFLLSS